MSPVTGTVLLLILGKWGAQLWLERVNQRHVLRNARTVPEPFRDTVDLATYAKSVQYTLAKSRLHQWETTYDLVLLLALLFSGLLPWGYRFFCERLGSSAWALSGFLFATGMALTLAGLPLAWYGQFRLEERFGFNTSTPRLWWTDHVKGWALAVLLGYPLLVLILKLVEWAGAWWWLWAWLVIVGFQLLMAVLAPVIILPLFNKFTPLPEGSLRERLWKLAQKTGFQARSIEVMDGSKRSRHSNAFFTGFGRFRRIVLFDTLIQHLNELELASVLAHEIGHFKKRHILKMLVGSAVALLAGLFVLAVLAGQDWFYRAFGFEPGAVAVAVLLFSLLAGVVSFWFSPLANLCSRHFEYQADAYAAEVMAESDSLIQALRKLNEKNLSNLTPHPLYSGFYYSHPALLEREQALKRGAQHRGGSEAQLGWDA